MPVVLFLPRDGGVIPWDERCQDRGLIVVARRDRRRLNCTLLAAPPAVVADDAAVAVMQLEGGGLQGALNSEWSERGTDRPDENVRRFGPADDEAPDHDVVTRVHKAASGDVSELDSRSSFEVIEPQPGQRPLRCGRPPPADSCLCKLSEPPRL